MKLENFKKGDIVIRKSPLRDNITNEILDNSFTEKTLEFHKYTKYHTILISENQNIIFLNEKWDDGNWIHFN